MFYGANASGKTTITQALIAFKMLIGSNSVQEAILNLENAYNPNKLHNLDDISSISISFFTNNKKYSYKIAYNSNEIKEEVLEREGLKNPIFMVKNSKVLKSLTGSRTTSSSKIIDIFEEQAIINGKQVRSFMNIIVNALPGLKNEAIDAFNYLKQKTITLNALGKVPREDIIKLLAKSNSEEDINNAFSDISNMIRKIDIEISRLEFTTKYVPQNSDGSFQMIPDEKVTYDILNKTAHYKKLTSYHTHSDGHEVEFDFNKEESFGTQVAFTLIGAILKILRDGGTLVVDEIDASLHTLVLQELIKMFKLRDINTNKSQLICTLHDTSLLENNIYRVSEFSFVDKSPEEGTFITRLSNIDGEKNELNFRKRYIKGNYFGIPYPYL
tara:strand:- start:323 stop:1477 length:1155 start_codon:yes stop_codon:yes gene_type:complete